MTEPHLDPLLRYLAGVLTAVGWLMIGLGGLCTLGIGILSSERHLPLTNWLMPATILAVGGALIWGGMRLRRSLKPTAGRGPDE